MWEEIKHEEKDPRKRDSNPLNRKWQTAQDSDVKPPNNHPKPTARQGHNGEKKTANKAEDKPRRLRGPREFTSGMNDKGQ